jgi:hypothetical protein
MLRMQRIVMQVCMAGLLCTTATAQMEATEESTAPGSLRITEHRFGLGVVDREIENEIDTFHKGDVVYLWMRVEGGPSDPIMVTWSSGSFQYDVELGIGGASWRTWARKTLFREGEWTVRVTDAAGQVLLEETLMVSDTPRAAEE